MSALTLVTLYTVYAVHQDTGEEVIEARGVALEDLEPDAEERAALGAALAIDGRLYVGGGAAPCFLLVAEESRCTPESCACGGYRPLDDGDVECMCGCPACDASIYRASRRDAA